MSDEGVGRVEDYTGAFLGAAWLLGVTGLTLIWGIWGYVVALALCAVLHVAIRRLGFRQQARDAAWTARVEAALARGRARCGDLPR